MRKKALLSAIFTFFIMFTLAVLPAQSISYAEDADVEVTTMNRETYIQTVIENSEVKDSLEDTLHDLGLQKQSVAKGASAQKSAEVSYKSAKSYYEMTSQPLPEELVMTRDELYNNFYSLRVTNVQLSQSIYELQLSTSTVDLGLAEAADSLLSTYFYTLQAQDIQARSLEISKAQMESEKLKYELGQIAEDQYRSDVIDLQVSEMQLAQTINQVKQLRFQVLTLAGLDYNSSIELVDDYTLESPVLNELSDYQKMALENRIEVKIAENNFKSIELIRDFYYQSGYNAALRRSSDGDYAVALANIEDTKAQVIVSVNEAYNDAMNARTTYEQSVVTTNQAKEQLNQAGVSYEQGLITPSNLQLAEIAYDSSLMTMENNYRTYVQAVDHLENMASYGTGN